MRENVCERNASWPTAVSWDTMKRRDRKVAAFLFEEALLQSGPNGIDRTGKACRRASWSILAT